MSRIERELEREVIEATPPVRRGLLWFGLLGGGVAWLIHLILAYVIAEFGCISGWGEILLGGITLVAWLTFGMSLLLLVVAGLVTLIAYRTTEQLARQVRSVPEEPLSESYMARAGYITSGVFFIIILVETLPIFFFLRSC